MRKDPDWKHHEGYPRDIGDDEGETSISALIVRTTALTRGTRFRVPLQWAADAGFMRVGHHVRWYAGALKGCSSDNKYVLGMVRGRSKDYVVIERL